MLMWCACSTCSRHCTCCWFCSWSHAWSLCSCRYLSFFIVAFPFVFFCIWRFPRSVSAGSIVAVMPPMRDATKNLASSTKTNQSFATTLVISLILLILEATQSKQCFFEISLMPYGHRVGTNKISNVSPNCCGTCWFLLQQRGVCDPRSPFYPCHFFSATLFRTWSFGILHHGWNDRECSRNLFSRFSLWADSQWSTRDPLLPSRIDDRVVDLSWCSSGESKKRQKLTWCTSCSLSYHVVRSDRTCSGRCRRPSTTDILCTVLWVQHRVVHTVQCWRVLDLNPPPPPPEKRSILAPVTFPNVKNPPPPPKKKKTVDFGTVDLP